MTTTPSPLRLLSPLTTTATSLASTSSSSPDFSCKSLKALHSTSSSFSLHCPSSPSCLSFLRSHHRCIRKHGHSLSRPPWLCGGHMRRDQDMDGIHMFGSSDEEVGNQIPTQAQSVVEGSGVVLLSEFKPVPDVDYLQELLAIQQQGPRFIGFFGTRNMGFMHQALIEILSYAMVKAKNHVFTSGASGTNAAVIRGALRAEKPELLTVKNVIEKPHNDHLPLMEASRLCNMGIISRVQHVICFAFHDSRLLMETCQEAKNMRKIVTLFYLD